MNSKRRHWLVSVAQAAGLGAVSGIEMPADDGLDRVWSTMAQSCGLSQAGLADYVASYYRLGVADLTAANPAAARLLPASVVRTHHVFPLREDDRHLYVATANPVDLAAQDAVGFASGRTPVFEVAPPEPLEAAIEARYSGERLAETMVAQLSDDAEVQIVDAERPAAVTTAATEDSPVVKLANLILRDAVHDGASDVHLQPEGARAIVRFRVDGVLRPYMPLALPVLDRVVSRIKVVASLDVATRLKPQDGRCTIAVGDRQVDLRVSTVPTRGSEKAVIRLLAPVGTGTLDSLAMPQPEVDSFRRLLTLREGIIAVTGPTGSGKTTTLYAALRELATGDVNIMTVEDPIEYELSGLTQMQVEPKQGVTFASALRAVLRQDPDIILVGEIRDLETAEIAVQASLTGHLVLATLHTNDAVGAVRRLLDLGLDRAAVAETLRGALAQRLLRRVCADCAAPVVEPLSAEEATLAQAFGVTPAVRAPGCRRCTRTGYRGRLPVVEIFPATPDFRTAIGAGAPGSELQTLAVAAGMRPLRGAALERERAGETTLAEVLRVLGDRGSERQPPDAEQSAPSGKTGPAVSRSTPAIEPAAPGPDGDGPRVLVADDEPTNRTFARALLEKCGCRVAEAVDGLDALRALGDGSYDLLVLDLDMPNLAGYEVLGHVRRHAATVGLPVIVFTTTADPESEAEVMERGADDYIRKPIDARRFTARVQAVLRRAAG